MTRRILPAAAVMLALLFAAVLIYLVYLLSRNLVATLFGDWRQVVVAIAAALVMGIVGVRLTMGKGRLADAGQIEKISVWAALLLSVVSAITTSLGLLLLLRVNPDTGSLLMVGMAMLLGIGIQLSMLMYALRIGEGIQRMTPVAAGRHADDVDLHVDEEERPRTGWTLPLNLLAVLVLVYVSLFLLFGQPMKDFMSTIVGAITGDGVKGGDWLTSPAVLSPLALLMALVLAVRAGILPRPGTLGGIGVSLAIYFALLMFSSGFGYMSYFMASQSPEVMAIDRDNRIETGTAALVRQIQEAAFKDENTAYSDATEGDEFQELSAEIDALSALFVKNRGKLDGQVQAFEARRLAIEAERQAAAGKIDNAKLAVRDSELAVERAKLLVTAAKEEQTRRLGTLQPDLVKAEKDRDDAAAGRDPSGIPICGPACRRAQAQVDRINKDIQGLQQKVSEAELGVSRAEADLAAARRTEEDAKTSVDGNRVDAPLPPPVTDSTSFTLPRNEYRSTPSKEALQRISQACSTAVEMLISVDVPPESIPRCETAAVETALRRHEELKLARERMAEPCTRTPDELAQEDAALKAGEKPDLEKIPDYLRGRLAWMTRCLTAANTGSENMNKVATLVNQLESEYTTPGYDSRRVLRSLFEGNLFAVFAALMAVVVDTAILFAGFAANAQRSQDLTGDHREPAPDRVIDSIEQALNSVSPGAPQEAAQILSMLWKPVPALEVGNGDYTRRLSLDGLDPRRQRMLGVILDAAGVSLVRFMKKDGESYWLLHQKFVQLINKRATSAASRMDAGDMMQEEGAYSSSFAGAAPANGFSPLYTSGEDTGTAPQPKRGKIDLGPEGKA